jgi:glycosyltransferase involved in cell wall biosynthesis
MPTANKIKILHIQLLPLLSGAQNMMLHLLAGLDTEQYEIFVSCKPDGPLVDVIKARGYHYLPVKSLRREISWWDFAAFFQFFFLCKKYKFDIVHTHSSKTGFLGRLAAKIAGVKKIIHTVHGFSFHEFQPKMVQQFYIFLETIAAKFCNKIVFVNDFERKLAYEKKIVSGEKGITIYNGITVPEQQKKIDCNAWQKKIIIGSVARFCKQKNSISMVMAAIKTVKKDNRFHFIFVGDGDLLPACKHMVKHAKMQKNIQFPGWSENINEWLLKMDVFFLFSKWEGLPISILEAMAIGLPAIVSDIKGNNELVSENTGALLSISEVDKLPAFFFGLLKNCFAWREKGLMARKMVKKKYNIEAFQKQYRELYAD